MYLLRCSSAPFVLLTYPLLSAVPFAPLLFGRTVKDPVHIFGTEVIAWITAWAVFKRPSRFPLAVADFSDRDRRFQNYRDRSE
jgi:hypothetical protein